MGFFSSIGKAFGFGNDAGEDAAEAQAAANRQAQVTRERGFERTESNLLRSLEGPQTEVTDPAATQEAFLNFLRQSPQAGQRLIDAAAGGGVGGLPVSAGRAQPLQAPEERGGDFPLRRRGGAGRPAGVDRALQRRREPGEDAR